MRRWSIEQKILAGFSLTLGVLAVVGASLYTTTVALIDTAQAAVRAQQALLTLESVYSLLAQAESRQRAYLLLGGDVDAQARQDAVTGLATLQAALDELVADDPAARHLPALKQRVAARMAALDAVFRARQDGLQAAQRQLAASPGRAEMQQVSQQVSVMQDELRTRLAQRQQAAQRNAERTLATLALLLVLVAGALWALYARIRRESAERRGGEERLRAVVETAGEGIVTIDSAGLVQSFNPAAERLFGYRAAEVVGRNVNLLMPEPHHSAHDGYLRRYLATGERHIIGTGAEVVGRRQDGRALPLGLAISEMRVGGQRLFTGILHDLTERHRAEQRQAELIQDLQTANDELKSFAYVVSHDLKAPLRGVSSLADWLLSDYADKLDDQGREFLALMKGRVSRMDALIDGILEYSRIGRVQQTRVEVDLNELLADVLQLLAPPPEVTVSVDGRLPTVVGERVRLQQVFQNLIGNAIRHRERPTLRVQVRCADAGSDWQFSVVDDGPGIEPRHHERVFQLFQVLTPRDKKEGTGVGLALVKKIVELHGGRVWLDSHPGEGAAFHFTLPKSAPISGTGGPAS